MKKQKILSISMFSQKTVLNRVFIYNVYLLLDEEIKPVVSPIQCRAKNNFIYADINENKFSLHFVI